MDMPIEKSVGIDSRLITISEAVILCNETEKFTRQSLMQLGSRYGFICYVNKRPFANKELLLNYIAQIKQEIPQGWVPVASMQHLAKNLSAFYRKLNRSGIEIRQYGREHKQYAKESEIRQAFENN